LALGTNSKKKKITTKRKGFVAEVEEIKNQIKKSSSDASFIEKILQIYIERFWKK
jgi:hypothetical protein